MKITLASHYGFCQGVKNAIKIAENAVLNNKKPIYMLNKIVHNQAVVDHLSSLGIITLDDSRSLEEKILSLNEGTIIFSAHGHDKKLEELAKKRGLNVVDTTCPKVINNVLSMLKAKDNQQKVVYIGVKKHPETIASLSIDKEIIFLDFFAPDYSKLNKDDEVSIHNQTTLIQKDLDKIYQEISRRVKSISIRNDICYATTLRQKALEEVTDEEVIFIVGDKISSNSTRLFEVCKRLYPTKDVFQISTISDLDNIDLKKYKKGFLTAGASTPESIINPILNKLSND